MESALQRLVQKTRPFKNFTFEGEPLKVRRTSVLENEAIARVYTDTYDSALKRLQDEETADYSLLHRSLAKETPQAIAAYLVKAAEEDIKQDVLDLYDGEEVSEDDPRIQEKVKEHSAKMQAELETLPKEELTARALDKREHFLALFEANKARMRMIATMTVYDADGNKFFPDADSVGELDESTLEELIKAASAALAEGVETSPLK